MPARYICAPARPHALLPCGRVAEVRDDLEEFKRVLEEHLGKVLLD